MYTTATHSWTGAAHFRRWGSGLLRPVGAAFARPVTTSARPSGRLPRLLWIPLAALALVLLALAPAAAQSYTITTRAGTGTAGFGGDAGAATAAQLNGPTGMAVDGSGNVFIVDASNQRIRKVNGTTGVITTVAGDGTASFGGDGGAATAAQLNGPTGVAVDGSGNVFIADVINHRIRKVNGTTGVITTLAGNGSSGFSGDGGAATAARLYSPTGVAVDGSGNVFIADYSNHRIRKVNGTTGVITTVAGNGSSGFSGDGGAANAAQLYSPRGVAVDGSGNLFIADVTNNRIRKVNGTTGVITTVAGTGTAGFAGDGGAANAAQLYSPRGVAVDGSGNVFIADYSNQRIRQVNGTTGVITTLAGTGTAGFAGDGGAANAAQLNGPTGVAVDGSGNLFIADYNNQRIRQVALASPPTLTGLSPTSGPVGTSVTLTGTGFTSNSTVSFNGTAATSVTVASSTSLTAAVPPGGLTGNVTVATYGGTSNGLAFTITLPTLTGLSPTSGPVGTSVTLTGTGFTSGSTVSFNGTATGATFTSSTSLTTIVPTSATTGTVTVTTPNGTSNGVNFTVVAAVSAQAYTITTRAGTGTAGFAGDGGAASIARLYSPAGVAIDGSGNVFIADQSNNRIRKVNGTTGVITTVAGNGTPSFGGDGAVASSAQLYSPAGMAVDGSGNVFIVDQGNNRIRKVSGTTGVITTVAGTGTAGFSGDGGPATSAQLYSPAGVAIDGSGNVFIVDQNNNRIRKVSGTTGVITTVAGTGTAGFSGDGGPATSAQLNGPTGMAVDGSGNVFIVDASNQRIRKVSGATGVITTVAGTGTAGLGDGGAATAAQLYSPRGVAVDGSGNVFIAELLSGRIRQVNGTTGVITTVAGTGTAGFAGDGGAANAAQLNGPTGMAVDGIGNVFIADQYNNRIRQLTPASPPTLTGLSPTSGPVGTSVTLTGTGFTSNSTVSFNGTAATSVTVASSTSLTAAVPPGGLTGNVTVATYGGTSNGLAFTVFAPQLTGVSPACAATGSTIILTGSNLNGASSIRFPGAASPTVTIGFTVNAAGTQITGVVVPAGATAGNVTAVTPVGTSNALTFLPVVANAPSWQSLTSFAPNIRVTSAAAAANGEVYLVGVFSGTAAFGATTLTANTTGSAFIAKWSPAQNTFVWALAGGGTSGGTVPSGVAVNGSSVYVTGNFSAWSISFGTATVRNQDQTSAHYDDGFLTKVNDAGNTASFVWATGLGGNAVDAARTVAVSGTSVYVGGTFYSYSFMGLINVSGPGQFGGLRGDIFVVKYADAGTTVSSLWARRAGGNGTFTDNLYSMAVSGTDLYVAGNFSGTADFGNAVVAGPSGYGGFVAKITDVGRPIDIGWTWVKGFAGTDYDYASAVAVNGSSVYVGGTFLSGSINFGAIALTNANSSVSSGDLFVAKLVDAGATASYAWAQQAGGLGNEQLGYMAASGTQVYIAGTYDTPLLGLGSFQLPKSSGIDTFVASLTDAGAAPGGFAWAQRAEGEFAPRPAIGNANFNAFFTNGPKLYASGIVYNKSIYAFGCQSLVNPAVGASYLVSLGTSSALATAAAAQPRASSLYPNPAEGVVTLVLANQAQASIVLTLRDAVGRTVRQFPIGAGTTKATLDVHGLPNGLYLVQGPGISHKLLIK